MRFIVMGMATKESEAGPPPPPEAFVAMQQYNEDSVKAGVLLAAEGLSPTSTGARVKLRGDECTVVDGQCSGRTQRAGDPLLARCDRTGGGDEPRGARPFLQPPHGMLVMPRRNTHVAAGGNSDLCGENLRGHAARAHV